jgi:hypothetical protein
LEGEGRKKSNTCIWCDSEAIFVLNVVCSCFHFLLSPMQKIFYNKISMRREDIRSFLLYFMTFCLFPSITHIHTHTQYPCVSAWIFWEYKRWEQNHFENCAMEFNENKFDYREDILIWSRRLSELILNFWHFKMNKNESESKTEREDNCLFSTYLCARLFLFPLWRHYDVIFYSNAFQCHAWELSWLR